MITTTSLTTSPIRRLPIVASSLFIAIAVFFAGPPLLTPLIDPSGIQNRNDLGVAVDQGFASFWTNGGRLESTFRQASRYWSTYHLLKCLFAAFVVLSASVLASRLIVRFQRAQPLGIASLWAVAGISVAGVGAFFSLLVIANLQGPFAPIASLLPTLTTSPNQHSMQVVAEAQRLAEQTHRTNYPPPLERMVSEFSRFHLVLAVLATVLAVLALRFALSAWRRSSRTATDDRRNRFMLRTLALTAAIAATALAIIATANAATAAAPIRAFAGALSGGF